MNAAASNPKLMTPRNVADAMGVRVERVRGWIHARKLRALNLSIGRRPTYAIRPADFERFQELSATDRAPASKPRGARRRRQEVEIPPEAEALLRDTVARYGTKKR
jgi:hypothetical protein